MSRAPFSGDFFERNSPIAVSPENQQARRGGALKAERRVVRIGCRFLLRREGNGDSVATADFWKAIYGWTSQLKIQFIVYDSLQGNVCGARIGKQHKERRFV
ncbi:MAG TPA: hypothetical protein VFS68_05080, partial [Candidatus Udaeobacter sp.]|nr:hypothetical protein [Candidatus Udaeobacter sp.]